VSTLAWSELGWGATQRPSLEHFAGLLGTACRAAELSRKLSLGRPAFARSRFRMRRPRAKEFKSRQDETNSLLRENNEIG